MSDNVSREEQAADEVARRWMATMQSMGDQLLRQQQASEQWMELAQKQQQAFQQMSQQWAEQAQAQQQTFQNVVQQSLGAYTELFKPPAR